MKLKVKILKWSVGVPGIMLNSETAKELGVNTHGRISIETLSNHPKKLITVVDTIGDVVKKNEVVVSSETKKYLDLRKRQKVDINIAQSPKSVLFVKKKLNNQRLSEKEINSIIDDVVSNTLSEPEIALFISAMYKKGMNFNERVSLIKAILKTGNKLSFKDKMVVDKHSIGGVPGNRTTPIIVSICAAGGLKIPKTSSKAITSAAGTADVIETIAKVEFSIKELKKIIRKTNAFMVWGGALGMVPADSKIIKVEKALKIDPESQLIASIMSKKLAAGSKYILIDIPYGKGSKASTKKKALRLKREFERLGKYFKKKIKVVLTNGSQPIGNGVGPVLELIDIINILDPKKTGPSDLEEKSVFLAGQLFELTGKSRKNQGEKMAREILESGKAFAKFKEIIYAQGGKMLKLECSKIKKDIITKRSGRIVEINNPKINDLARIAGCPTDKYSGLYIHHHVGEKIKSRQKLITIYAESKPRLNEAVRYCKKEKPIRVK